MDPPMNRLVTPLAWIWVAGLSLAWLGAALDYPDQVMIEFGVPAILFLWVGALLATRVRENLIGRTLMVGASAWLVYDVGQAYAAASLERGPFPLAYAAAWLGAWTGPLAFLMIPVLLVLFPDGRFTGRRRWFLPFFGLILVMISIGAILLWGLPAADLIDDLAVSDVAAYVWVDLAYPLSWMLAIPAALSLMLRYRRSSRVERQQTKWFLASVIAAPVLAVAGVRILSDHWQAWAIAISVSLLPIAIGVAVLRYRLYDLGRVVSRTVTYAVVVGLLVALVAVAAAVVGTRFEQPAAVAVTTLGVAAVFNPLRRRVQTWVDRRFNRSGYDAQIVMDDFAGSLRDRTDPVEVVDGWMGVIADTMEPAAMGVWMRDE
jgi:hypothetical protein